MDSAGAGGGDSFCLAFAVNFFFGLFVVFDDLGNEFVD